MLKMSPFATQRFANSKAIIASPTPNPALKASAEKYIDWYVATALKPPRNPLPMKRRPT
jgi:hypothetical protein